MVSEWSEAGRAVLHEGGRIGTGSSCSSSGSSVGSTRSSSICEGGSAEPHECIVVVPTGVVAVVVVVVVVGRVGVGVGVVVVVVVVVV